MMKQKLLLLILFFAVALAGCSKSQVTDNASDGIGKLQVKNDEKTCTTPWGETVKSGETRKGFKKRNLSLCTDSCESQSALLSCIDGTLSGGAEYLYDRCEKPFCDCELPFLPLKPKLKHGDWISLYKAESVQCGSCDTVKEDRQCVDGKLSGSAETTKTSCQSLPCKNCTVGGSPVAHGQSKDLFKSSTGLSCKPLEMCAKIKLTRTCQNGVLSGDPAFNQASCVDERCKCTFDGKVFNDGASVPYYSQAVVTCVSGLTCAGIQGNATCNNGTLVNLPTGKVSSCTQQSCNCTYTDSAGKPTIVFDGQDLAVYPANNLTCGQSCTMGKVSCLAGKLSGNIDYKVTSCAPPTCTCTAPWGSVYTAGETIGDAYKVPFFKTSTSTCGQNKCATLSDNKRDYYCLKNGTNTYWVDASLTKVTDFSGYVNNGCSDPTCYCNVNGQNLREGSSQSFYKKNQVDCGKSCDAAGQSMSVRCKNDLTVEIFPAGSNINAFIGASNTCAMAACTPQNGNAIPEPPVVGGEGDGVVGDGGGDGGALGDGEGPGFHFKGRGAGGPGSGGPGAIIFLNVDSTAPFGEGCVLPWGQGKQIVTHFASVVAFSKTSVPAGQKCSDFRFTRMCVSGKLEGNSSAIYLNCVEP